MSQWINFVKRFAKDNGLTYGEALKEAGPYYEEYMGNDNEHMEAAGYRRRAGAKNFHQMAEELLGYHGGEAQKGALAALLSGLDAQIKIK